jgi:integrase
MDAALKPNTKKTYTSAQTRFLTFCSIYNLPTMSVTEDILLLYVSYLFEEGLSASSIRVYLAAVRSLHVFSNEPYPTNLLRVRLALKGAVRNSPLPKRKLPITFTILRQMLSHVKLRHDKTLIDCVMTLAFFGCLRLAECCIVDGQAFNPKIHLCVSDVKLDYTKKQFSLFIKQSKTDSSNAGVYIYIGCSRDTQCCAYCSMRQYMSVRITDVDPDISPLFILPGGSVLFKSYLVKITRLLLSMSGLDPSLYSGHSFRAGAATSAGDNNFRDWEVQLLGRWSSQAYTVYMRNPQITASFAHRLASKN